MTATTFPMWLETEAAAPSRLARLLETRRRRRADARARRALAQLDARTLRDIGLTQLDAVFFSFANRQR